MWIPDLKNARKFASMKLAAIGALVQVAFIAIPDDAYVQWLAVPESVRAVIPEKWKPIIGALIFTAVMVARVYKQKSIPHDKPTGKE